MLILELGYGEPEDESYPGATKNPREWISILENDGRDIYCFVLQIPEAETLQRVQRRHDLLADYAKMAHDRYKPGGVCDSPNFTRLMGRGLSEETIDTNQHDLATTVARIVTKIGPA
jgi:hypothetical protein